MPSPAPSGVGVGYIVGAPPGDAQGMLLVLRQGGPQHVNVPPARARSISVAPER